MALAGDILADIDLRYRNSFTSQQKAVWMNDEQNDIFNIFKIDIGPVNFPLQTGVQFYIIPPQITDANQIRTATIQVNSSETYPEFVQLPYRRDDNDVMAGYGYWYTIVGDALFINIPPGDNVDDRQVYFYLDGAAIPITDGSSPISVPNKYLEIMKYGVLRRIAEARKDTVSQRNFDASRQEIISDLTWTAIMDEPQWVQPTSSLPRPVSPNRLWPVNGW